jgi:hypothetical protein
MQDEWVPNRMRRPLPRLHAHLLLTASGALETSWNLDVFGGVGLTE